MFKYDTIYYGRYTCTTNPHIYDMYPLFLPLEIKGRTMICVNLHWIPGALRNKFVQVIIEMRNKCINESLFHLWYRTIKFQPPLHFALGAIRKYYMSNMTNVKIVPDTWEMLTITSTLYKARYMQKSSFNPQQRIVQKGRRQYPNQRPQMQQQIQSQQPQIQTQPQQGNNTAQ
jgi:hypothetical protein